MALKMIGNFRTQFDRGHKLKLVEIFLQALKDNMVASC